MTTHIALAGKGSAGKSTLLPHLVVRLRHARPDIRLLVVDADPHMSATALLGVAPPATLGQLRSRYERTLARGDGLRDATREAFAECAMGDEALLRAPGFDLLALGHWELSGSQCVVNRVLERALVALVGRYDVVLYDHEAGIEHVGRFGTMSLDLLLLLTTPDPLFLDVAGRVLDRCREVGRSIARRWLVVNCVRPDDLGDNGFRQALRSAPLCGAEVVGLLPESPALRALSRARTSPLLLDPADPWGRAVDVLAAQVIQLAPPPAAS